MRRIATMICIPNKMRSCIAPRSETSYQEPGENRPAVAQDEVNEQIEDELKRWKDEAKSELKLLLLGSAESGKSTILKQLKLLHINNDNTDFGTYVSIIHANIVTSMGNILLAMRNLGIVFENPEREVDKRVIFDVVENGEEFEPLSWEVAKAIENLWKDEGVKQCYERRNEFQLNDSAKHFFDSINRMIASLYRPTVEDMLCARAQTTGITEIKFGVKDIMFKVIDVGGQRSERRKWLHCFDCVQAVIFITAISEFNQTMREDSTMNRLLDSIGLFEYVCNNEFLKDSAIILFMNKIDLFQEKIDDGFSISEIFPDYTGKQNFDESCKYVEKKFLEANNKNDVKRQIYVHTTCAIDCGQVQRVLLSCEEMILENNMRKTALV